MNVLFTVSVNKCRKRGKLRPQKCVASRAGLLLLLQALIRSASPTPSWQRSSMNVSVGCRNVRRIKPSGKESGGRKKRKYVSQKSSESHDLWLSEWTFLLCFNKLTVGLRPTWSRFVVSLQPQHANNKRTFKPSLEIWVFFLVHYE